MESQIQLSEFVGEHGCYQLFMSLLLFFRYMLLGLMANSGSLLTPDVTFYCSLPREEVAAIMPNISLLNQTEQELEIREEFKRVCQLDLHLYQPLPAHLNGSSTLASSLPGRPNASVRYRECSEFSYDIAPDQGRTMTSEFDLVCERDSLRSIFQSLLSAAIVLAHIFWGTFSDKYGRHRAQKLCLLVSLLAGGLSLLAADFWTFALARALCSFGDLGLVVSLTTTLVELVGSRYRGLSVASVNFGFALGVALLPYVVAHFEDFRMLVLFTLLCHLASAPFVLLTGESVRWLLTNRKFHSARRELGRIVAWNSGELVPRGSTADSGGCPREQALELLFERLVEQIESPSTSKWSPEQSEDAGSEPVSRRQLSLGDLCLAHKTPDLAVRVSLECMELEPELRPQQRTASCGAGLDGVGHRYTDALARPARQADCINLVTHQLSFMGRVNRLFRDKRLMVAVFTIVWTTFNSELLYTSFIIINLEVGEDLYLNYILGGCMEALAALTASLLLSYAPRRHSLIAFWLLISLSCFGLSAAHIDSTWAVWLLALAKFCQSALSSIASVAAYESFPTLLRQSGSGLVFTLGMLGSVFAPLIFAEFDDQVGMDRVLMTFSLSSLTAAALIYWLLRETRNCELE